MEAPLKNLKKVINGWAIYDWANSAYFLVISTAIFPSYFAAYTPEDIQFLGMSIPNETFYSYSVSFSYFIIMLLSPLLSGIADYGGKRMLFLKSFTIIGSLACIMLYFFKGEPQLWLGTGAFIVATIGCAGSLVFYNAYLPEIATEDQYDRVSAKGFSYGYVGSVILLILILVLVIKPEMFGITDEGLPARIGFVMVGIWWLGFAQISFRRLPKSLLVKKSANLVKKGLQEILTVAKRIKGQHNILKFLIAFFFYSAGVQTVIYLAAIFGQEELGFGTQELIIIILILQLVAIGGAYLFAYVSKKQGNKLSLLIMITIWVLICVGAYFVSNQASFYVIAAFVGLVMGGIQSLSRSTYSKLIDEYKTELTSYFSFYDILYKGSIVFGTFAFGFVNQITGNMRLSVLVLGLFFVIGGIVLMFVRMTWHYDEKEDSLAAQIIENP